jgi:pimeloyl-ACP methyl ester carboxylesterase
MNMGGDANWREFLEGKALTHYVNIGEHRLRTIELGTGEPVLLIHGFADSSYCWHRNLGPLAEAGFRAIAFDLPGCGRSDLPSEFRYGVDNLAQLTVELLDRLGIPQAHVIGASMGGGVALSLAVHQPERVGRVVAVAPVCYHPPFRPFVYLFRYRPLAWLIEPLVGPWLADLALQHEYGDSSQLRPHVADQYRLESRRPEYQEACMRALRDFWNESFTTTAELYSEIGVPLYLVWGARDSLISPRRYGPRLAADTGATLTLISGAGHVVQMERSQEFNAAVIDFLSEGYRS